MSCRRTRRSCHLHHFRACFQNVLSVTMHVGSWKPENSMSKPPACQTIYVAKLFQHTSAYMYKRVPDATSQHLIDQAYGFPRCPAERLSTDALVPDAANGQEHLGWSAVRRFSPGWCLAYVKVTANARRWTSAEMFGSSAGTKLYVECLLTADFSWSWNEIVVPKLF